MNISALFEHIDWQAFLTIYLGVFGLAVAMFRRCAYGAYDPAWIAVAAISVSVTLVAYLYQVEQIGAGAHVAYIALTLFAFLLGVRGTDTALRHLHPMPRALDLDTPQARRHLQQLRRILGLLQVLIIAMVVIRAAVQGLPILAEDPELAKVEVNAQGFGLITRLLGPSVTMGLSITFLLWAKRVFTRRRALLALLPSLLALLASGSKGGMLAVLVSFTAVQAYLMGMDATYRAPRASRVLMLATAAILGYALLVLLLRAAGAGEGDPLVFALTTFGVRLIAFGDGVFYFFVNDLHTTLSFQPLDYVWDYLLAPVLAILRLIEYPITLGLKISGEMFGQEKLGPNPTLFVEGYAYFGTVLGPVYAACLGILFQALRSNAFPRNARFTAWGFLRFAVLFPLAQAVTADMLLFVAEAINTALVAAVLWTALALRRSTRLRGRRLAEA